jgi:Trk K+ transport system NAD-binding subunit
MNIWFAVALILAVVSVYLFTIEAFCVAFKLTGLATNKIKFQVASLFTGSGFTTNESELIVDDERRRKIAIVCMYTGHVFSVVFMGLLTNVLISIATITNSNSPVPETKLWYYIVFYVSLGLFLFVLFLKIPPINRRFQSLLEKIAINTSSKKKNTNIITVLDLYGKNAIAEVVLNNIPEFAQEKTLYEMALTKKYFINVLSIKRGKRILEVTKDTMFNKRDVLVIYGSTRDIKAAFIDSLDKNKKTVVVNKTNDINLLNTYGTNVLMEIDTEEVPKELEGIPMKDAHLSDRYSITIVVIKRKDNYLFVDKDTILQNGDKITCFGPYQNIKHLFNNSEK